MVAEELKEYLGIVVDMEQNIYLQKSLLFNIGMEIEQLKIPPTIDDPVEPTEPIKPIETAKPAPQITVKSVVWLVIECLIYGFVYWFLSTAVIMFLVYNVIKDLSLDWLILFGFVPPIVKIVSEITLFKKWNNEYKAKMHSIEQANKERMDHYQEQMDVYRKQLDLYYSTLGNNLRERKKNQTERRLKTIFLQSQKEAVEKGLADSEAHLQVIYKKGIVFPKYRNLVMVCSLYEYICAGRCTKLEGSEGAYNILEAEIRLDRIISQLDNIIVKLEEIKKNQYALYSAVKEANRRLGQICNSFNSMSARLEDFYYNSCRLNEQVAGLSAQNAELNAHIIELQSTSELTAYYTERTQKELAYMNRMDYLSGRNDDVFFNHPPV